MELLVTNRDTQLFTTAYPNPGKETVILLHGGPGAPGGMTFVAHYLAKHFQVIHFHRRGTLKSSNPAQEYSMESYVSDINRIAELFQVEKFHLLGHSWGGLYAQVYAQQNAERLLSLFLANSAAGTGRQWAETSMEIARYNRRKCTVPEFIAMNLHTVLGLLGSDAGYRKFYSKALENFSREFKEKHPEAFAVDCIKANAINETIKSVLKSPQLSEMRQPGFKISIVYGDQDSIGESRRHVWRRYPTAAKYVIPRSGHIPWSYNQPEFVRVLKEHYRI